MIIDADHRPSDSPYIERVWRSSASDTRMCSIANTNWGLVVWEHDRGDGVHVAIRGPETAPKPVEVSGSMMSFGIVFAHGAFMPHLPLSTLVDTAVQAPHVTAERFTLRGESWELPRFDSAEEFVTRLVRGGVLVRDPLVSEVLAGAAARDRATRSVQRRVATTTGLSRRTIGQIERARHAAMLLEQGTPVRDVVYRLGFYDHPHLAHALHRFVGRTATELSRPASTEPLSLIYRAE